MQRLKGMSHSELLDRFETLSIKRNVCRLAAEKSETDPNFKTIRTKILNDRSDVETEYRLTRYEILERIQGCEQ